MKNENLSFDSICIKDSHNEITTQPHQLPIYATSSFEFKDIHQGIDIFSGKEKGHVYSRYGNPTIEAAAKKIAQLENFGLEGEALALMTSSGMSAISTLISSILNTGDKILTQGNLYGGTTELFVKQFASFGIETCLTNLQSAEETIQTIRENPEIKVIYFETPANPTLSCIDIENMVNIAKKYGLITIVDNTFPTPYLSQPFKYGVDFIIHSTTKYLNGHGNSIAGIILGKDPDTFQKVWQSMKLLGTNCNPWDAWLVNNGLKTLSIRMEKHSSNAMQLASFLEAHQRVNRVNYNGLTSHPDHELAKKQMRQFGGMLSFEVAGPIENALAFMNRIKFCTLAPTLGDVDTLILHPASMSHLNVDKEIRLQNGITDGLVRVSVGIEGINDIINDMKQALNF